MIESDTIIDGRYRVISRLGSGGMADVYLAQDQLLGREVAVKVLHHHFAEDHEFVERFRREASSAAALSHPNIVGIFDRGEWNGTYYIAMEYVAGRSLKQIVREDGALDPASAIDVVVQILRAARFAHRRGVIHRDLKPHNVILDEEGRARVTDFGIARAGASDMTLTGSIMGTAQYLSPEQAQGFAVSDASDLYSVGVILYELLTGVVPFEGESAVAIAFKQVSAAPRPPSALNPAIPPSLDAVVMRALAKDPAQRYANADELITALQRERDALPAYTGATVVGAVGAVAAPPAQPPPVPPAGGQPMFFVPPPYSPPQQAPPSPEDRHSKKRRALIWTGVVLLLAAAAVALVLVLGAPTPTVRVPNLTGYTEPEANAALRRAGLSSYASLEPSEVIPSDRVISQRPGAGASIKKGSRVNIVISSGPLIKGLVDVNGDSADEAVAKLKKAGFKPVVKHQPSTTVPQGKVIATEPSAGSAAVQGSPVTVLVSSGPPPVSVPDLTGDSLSAAEATLASDKLVLGTVTKKPSSSGAPGTVLSQSPTPSTSVKAGSSVELTIAEMPKPSTVAVPTVVGQSDLAAEAAIERVGLVVQVKSVVPTEAGQQGTVLRQSPSGGTHAQKGSTVIIFVAVGGTSSETTGATTSTSPSTPAPSAPGSESSQ